VRKEAGVVTTLEDWRGNRDVDRLMSAYEGRKNAIQKRLREFREIGRRPDAEIFEEMCFCLLTPQSKARVCDKAVRSLAAEDLLANGSTEEILPHLEGVRFRNGKARWIVAAREQFFKDGQWVLKKRVEEFQDALEAREWLVANMLGMGYKEAGHFLRNIGKGEELAILDRHIMKNLLRHGVIDMVPTSLSKREYLRIEALVKEFSGRIGIPMADLDLLFWSNETGEIFK